MRTLTASVALAIALATQASAQHDRPRPLDTVYVGAARLSNARIHNDSSESLVLAPDSASPNGHRVIGRLTEMQRVVNGAKPSLVRVNHFSAPGNDVTDSIMTLAAGLVPVWETSHQTAKVMHLKFDGRRVTGDVTPTGKSREQIDQTMAVAPFNSSDVFLVASSLPLAADYRVLLATYEYESHGLRVDTLSVVGRESLTVSGVPHDTWVVRISRGPTSWMTAWIDRDSRSVMQQEFSSNAAGWRMRMVRQ